MRITATWPAPSVPSRWAAAVAASAGGNGSPVRPWRAPRSRASLMRRAASARLISVDSAIAWAQCAAEFLRGAWRGKLIDQRVLGCAQPARHALQALQGPQPFWGGEHVKGQRAQGVQIVIERAEDLSDILTTARTHA